MDMEVDSSRERGGRSLIAAGLTWEGWRKPEGARWGFWQMPCESPCQHRTGMTPAGSTSAGEWSTFLSLDNLLESGTYRATSRICLMTAGAQGSKNSLATPETLPFRESCTAGEGRGWQGGSLKCLLCTRRQLLHVGFSHIPFQTCSHFTDEATEVPRREVTSQGRSWDLNQKCDSMRPRKSTASIY